MKKLLFLFVLICSLAGSLSVRASHIEAADLTFKCVGPHQYQITFTAYRDCSGIAMPSTVTVDYSSATCGISSSITLTKPTGVANGIDVTDTCPGHHSGCNGSPNTGTGVEQYVYTGVLNLPSGCGADWIISYRDCCRNNAISTINNPGAAGLYIQTKINNTLATCDNSPKFLNYPTARACVGQVNYINQGGFDPDGDSLSYQLVPSMNTATTAVIYIGGNSPTTPMPVAGTFGFDPTSGQITFVPSQSSVSVVKVLVNEYRAGVLIGQVERDLQIVAQLCDSLPKISGVSGPNSSDSVFTIPACANNCFTVYSSSTSTSSSIALTLSVTGQASFPGATFSVSSGPFPTLTFCWTPTRNDAGTHTFYVKVKDNSCPTPGSSTRSYTLKVPQTYPAGADQTICQYNTATMAASGTGTWSPYILNPIATTIANTTSPTTVISGFNTPGWYRYVWSTTNGCLDTTSVFVTSKPNAGPNDTICQYSNAVMAATGSGTWSAAATNPTATTFSLATSPTATISGFTVAGTYYYYWTNNGCKDTAIVLVKAQPQAGPDQIVCQNTTVVMAGVGTGTWTALSTNPTVATITNPASATTSISGLSSVGVYSFVFASNGCTDTVNITVNGKPYAGTDQTICQYTSATMNATGTGTWSALASNPTVVTFSNATSPTSTVSGFTAAGNYNLLWSNNGCSDTVLVTVNAKPNAGIDKTICQYNTVTMTGAGSGTWTTAASNPIGTTITNTTLAATVVTGFTTAGLYTYYWTNNGCSDTVNVTVNAKPNAGTDQTICQYNSATMNASGTGTWSALATNPAAVTFNNATSPITSISGFTAAGNYNLLWTNNGCADTVLITVTAKPNAGTDKTICQYGTVTMTGTGTGTWTSAAANPVATTINNTTSPITSISGFSTVGSYTYYWTNNGCSDTVTITVNAQPTAGPDQTICQYNTVTMAATGTGTWAALAGNPATVSFANATSPTSTVSGFTAAGNYNFTYSANGCSDTVRVTVTAKPNAGTDKTICQYGTVTMTGTGTGTWTSAAANPIATTINNPTSPITTISGFSAVGNYTYYWTNNGCSDTVVITVNAQPTAGPDQTICQYNSVTMAATGTGTWTALAGNPAVVTFTSASSPTSTVSGFTAAGNYNFTYSANGCSDTVLITVIAKPNAGTDKTICQYNTVTMNGTGTGTWTAAASNPIATTITNSTLATTTVSGFTIAGMYTYYWSNNGCTDTVVITVNGKPNAGTDQTICQYSIATMAATGSGTWSAVASNPAVVSFSNSTSATTTVTGFNTAGTYTLLWSNNGCADTVLVIVIAKPNAGSDKTICQYNSVTMTATGVGTWTASPSNPVATTFSNATSPTTGITGFSAAGSYTYYWSNNGCSDTVNVAVNAKPDAGLDQGICLPGTITTAATGTGVWTAVASNPATTSFANPNNPVTIISGFTTGGTYTYIWTNSGCADTMTVSTTATNPAGPDQTICQFSTATTAAAGSGSWTIMSGNPTITTLANTSSAITTISGFTVAGIYRYIWTSSTCIDTLAITVTGQPNAGIDQVVCQYSTITMAASGTGTWSALNTNPAASTIVTPTSATSLIRGFTAAGTYGFVWAVGSCTDTMFVAVTAKPNAGADQTVCQNTTATMNASGTGTWTALASNPTATTISNTTSPTTTISGLNTAGVYGYIWTNNGCADTVNLTVTAKPNAGADQTICQFSTATMAATGTGTWSAQAGNPATTIIATPSSATTSISGFTVAGTYYYIWRVSTCSDTMSVTVTSKPNAGADQTICQYNAATMNATGSGTWTAAASNPAVTALSNTTSPTSGVTGFSTAGTYTYFWSNNGCNDTMNINVTAKPNAGADQTLCQYSTATMAASGTGTWSALTTNPSVAVIANAISATTNISGFNTAGTYLFVWTNNSCSDTLNINITAKPDAGPDQTICQYTSTNMAATGTGTWTASASNPAITSFGNNTSPTSSVAGFSVAGLYTFFWSNNSCTDTINITVTAKPNAGADQTLCQYTNAIMAATGTGSWSALTSNPSVATITNATSPTTSISGLSTAGVYGFVWTSAGCIDTVNVSITAKPNAGADQSICQYSTTAMNATGTGTWSVFATNPAVITFGNPSSATSSVSGFTAAGIYKFLWSLNGCNDTVNIIVTAKPNAGPDQTVCQFTNTAMAATGTGTWSAAATNPSTATLTNINSATTGVSNLNTAGVYTFYWTKNGCIDTVNITVTAKPNAGADQSLCLPGTITTTATGAGLWTALVSNPALTSFANSNSPTTVISGYTASGAYNYLWTVNGCVDTMAVIVVPIAPAGPDQTICQNDVVTTTAYGAGAWTPLSTNPITTVIANSNAPTTTISGFSTAGSYGYIWSVNNCTDTFFVTVVSKPNAGADQNPCQYATTAMNATGTGTWSALTGNPAVVTFANSNSPTTAVSGFTVAGLYTFLWSLNGCSDTVVINVTAKPIAGVDQTICQYNTITMAASGSGTWTALVSNPAVVTFANTTSPTSSVTGFNTSGLYTFLWSLGGCDDTMTVTVTAKPNAGVDQTICQYNSIVMNASGTGTWTAFATNPAVVNFASLNSATSAVTGFNIAGTYKFLWSLNGCSDTVNIVVTAKPNAGNDQTICQYSNTSMTATGSGTWTAAASNPAAVTFVNAALRNTVVRGFTSAGVYTFYWTQNGCSDTVNITVTAKPDAGADQTICQYSTVTMNATGTGTWSVFASNPSAVIFTNNTSPTTNVSGFAAAGTYKFLWSLNGCNDTVNVIVTAKPNAGVDQTICQYSSTTMTATGVGTWSALTGNPSAVSFSNSSSPTSTVSGFNAAGIYTFLWSLNGCDDTVQITVNAKPDAGIDQSICLPGSITTTATGAGNWTSDVNNPTATNIVDPTLAVTSITGFIAGGTYTYYRTLNGCIDTMAVTVVPVAPAGPDQTICQYNSLTTAAFGSGTWTALPSNPAVTVIANNTSGATTITGFNTAGTYVYTWSVNNCLDTLYVTVIAKPNAGVDQTICQYSTATMTATGSGSWSALASNPALVSFANNTAANTTVSSFTATGVYTFLWSLNGCDDTVSITVTVKPNAGTDQTICQYTTTTMTATGTGTWTAFASNPATVTFANSTLPTSSVTGFNTAGIYSFLWSEGGCDDTVNITVTPKPNAGTDQTICQYTSATMSATGSGTWTAQAGNPAATVIANPGAPNTSISGFTVAGSYKYLWSLNGCSDTAIVTVVAKPSAGADKIICQYNTVLMTATGTGTWSAAVGNPAATIFANATVRNTAVTGFTAAGVYTYYWALNGCEDTVNITVNAKPDAGADQTICQYSSAALNATGTGIWTPRAGNPATVTISNNTSPSSNVSGFTAAGAYYFLWTNNGCSDTVAVIVTPKPNAGPDQTICQFSSTAMTATGTGTWSAMASNPSATTFADNTSPTSAISGFTSTGSYSYIWSLSGCDDTMTISVTAKPDAGTDQTICQYSTALMSATGTGGWSALAGNPSTVVITNNTDSITAITGFNASGTYTFIWSNNGCSDTALVNVTAKPNAGSDQTICQYSTTALSATGTGTWSALASNPVPTTFVNNTSPTAVVSGFSATGIYTYIWSLNGCDDTVNISVTAKPGAGADQTTCQYSTATMSATGSGTWTAIAGNPSTTNISSTIDPTTIISGFTSAGVYYFLWSNNGCGDTAAVNVTAKPNAGSDQTICQYISTALNATGTGTWSALATNPAATTFTNSSSSNTSVSGFSATGIYTFIWSLNGCDDTMNVSVIAKPDAGTDQTICQYAAATMSASGAGTWAAISGNPASVIINNANNPSTTITGFNTAGIYYFTWTNNGCADTAVVNVTAKPNAGNDQNLCLPGVITTAASGAGSWAAMISNPEPTTFANAASATTTISGFSAPGVYSFVWMVNGCDDTMSVLVTPPSPAGADQTTCQYSSILTGAYGVGSWAQSAANPSVTTIANSTADTTAITNFTAAGNYYFTWSVNGCVDSMMITVNAKPDAGTDKTTCQFSTATMTATGTGLWSALATNPSATSFSNGSSATATISGFDSAGVYTFLWTLNGCSDTMNVTVNAKPDAGADQTICQYSITSMAATGAGIWSALLSNPAALTFTNISAANTSVSGFTASGLYYVLRTNNGCSDTMLISVTPKPDAGSDQSTCQFSTATVSAIGLGNWSSLSSNPSVTSFIDSTQATTSMSGFASAGIYSYVWTVNGCTDTSLVNVTVKPNAGSDQTICQYTTTSMTAAGTGSWTALSTNPLSTTIANPTSGTSTISGFNSPGNYAYVWTVNGCDDTMTVHVNSKPNAGPDQLIPFNGITYMSASGTLGSGQWYEMASNPSATTFADVVDPASFVSGFNQIGSYGYEWIVSGCPDSMYITVKYPPNAGTDQAICQDKTITLDGTGNGTWSQLAGNPAVVTFADSTLLTTSVTGFTAPGVYYLVVSYAGLQPDTVTVTVYSLPVPNVSMQPAVCVQPAGSAAAHPYSGRSPYTYMWNTGATTDSIGHLYYNDFYAVTVTDANNCTGIDTGRIGTSRSELLIAADSVIDISCHGYNNGAIYIPVYPTWSYQWSNGATGNAQTHMGGGTYTVSVYDPLGCSGTATYTLIDPPAATLQIHPHDTSIVEDNSLFLSASFGPFNDSVINSYQWSPSEGLNCNACPAPEFTSASGRYTYSLLVTYGKGCTVSDTMRVVVSNEHRVYIPNAFTPNGDGANDVYYVYAKHIRFFELNIYDRWGEKVYESNDDGAGWNGQYKGTLMEPGVYVYTVDLTFDDGYTVHNKGSITLIR